MAIRNATPVRFSPKGLVDAFDATDIFKGACQSLANWILDQSNPGNIVARPGVTPIINLSGQFTNPGFVSVHATIGTRIYGLVATSRNLGNDEPFCYDTATNTFVIISGVTAGNTPASPNNAGDWEPPTMASVGKFILFTHPGFSGGGSNFFGVLDLTVPSAPVWSSANTTTNGLTARPSAVANYRNRAYFAVGNTLQYTDALSLTRTASTQSLTLGDSSALNALSGLPMQTTSSGVIGALTAFKATQVWQITGDPTTNDLAENFLSLQVGTNSPRSISQSTQGLYFASPGGPYVIDPLGTLRPLTNNYQSQEPDIQVPFQNAITPTRWAGYYNASIYRVCGTTVVLGVQQINDYWFDEHRRRWTGPHSFPYDCASATSTYFVLSSAAYPGFLILSQSAPQLNSVYTDLGASYNCTCVSCEFPDTGDMSMHQVVESQIELGGTPQGASYTIVAQNADGSTIAGVTLSVAPVSIPRWGDGRLWGDGSLWTSAQARALLIYPIPWPIPLVFDKMQLLIAASASANISIGKFYARYQKTGYMTTRKP